MCAGVWDGETSNGNKRAARNKTFLLPMTLGSALKTASVTTLPRLQARTRQTGERAQTPNLFAQTSASSLSKKSPKEETSLSIRRQAAKITVPSLQSDFPNHTLSYDARDESKDPPLVSYREMLSYISSETHTDAEMFAPRATCSIGADNTRKARRHGGLGRAPQSGRETARGTLKNGKDAGRLPSGRRRAHSVC